MLVRSLAGLRCALQVPWQGLMFPGPGQNQLLRTGICSLATKRSSATAWGGGGGPSPSPHPPASPRPFHQNPCIKGQGVAGSSAAAGSLAGGAGAEMMVQEQNAAAGGCRSRAPGADGCTCPLANSPVPKPGPLHPHLATGCIPREAVDLSTQRSKCHRRRKYFQIGSYSRQNQPSPCHVCSQVLHMGIHGSFFFLPPKATSKASDLHHMFLTLLSNTVL